MNGVAPAADEDLPPVDALGPVHLVGVGGAGMSVVAALLAARGVAVSGSDARDGAVLRALAALGVRVEVGHAAGHLGDARTVVVSSAVPADNPERAEGRRRGLRELHRSRALAALMAGHRAVAVAGAHGKTTTSAMVAVVLRAAGLDPTYAIGGSLRGDDPARSPGPLGGAHLGAGDVFVAEADESDGSFLAYRPQVAVVTNIEPDHLDHYGDAAAFEAAFAQFGGRVGAGGWVVACADDDGARRLVGTLRADGRAVVTYGTADDADVRVADYAAGGDHDGEGARFRLVAPGGPAGPADVPVRLAVPGLHNARNAAAAWTVARLLGVDGATAAAALGAFVGTGRRFEDRGTAGGVRVVDDYAHHPTEIDALLAAARPLAAPGRVLVLFQPHLYSRTRIFAPEFARALSAADELVVAGIYGARERPEPGVTSALVVDALPAGHPGRHVEDRLEAARVIARLARPGDLLLTVGAGDVTELADVVLAELAGDAR